jgi:aldehyde oxidoreductase
VDGKLVRSCVTKMSKVPDGASVTTIEGIGTPDRPASAAVAWIVHGGAQCGFCTPASSFRPRPCWTKIHRPPREVRDWFQKHRNACRCTGYKQLVDAVMDAAKVLRGEMKAEDLNYKIARRRQIWGTNYPRPTAVAKVTGTWITARTWASSCPR